MILWTLAPVALAADPLVAPVFDWPEGPAGYTHEIRDSDGATVAQWEVDVDVRRIPTGWSIETVAAAGAPPPLPHVPRAWTVDHDGRFAEVDLDDLAAVRAQLQLNPDWERLPDGVTDQYEIAAVQRIGRAAWGDLVGDWTQRWLGDSPQVTDQMRAGFSFGPQHITWQTTGTAPCGDTTCVVLVKTEGTPRTVHRTVTLITDPATLQPWQITVSHPGGRSFVQTWSWALE